VAQALIWHSLAFVVVTALLLAVLIRARLAFATRLLITVAAATAYLLHYAGLEALTGRPTGTGLPEEFDVLGTRIVEPRRSNGEPGRIELWIREAGSRESRLHRLPYSSATHEEVNRASSRMRRGLDQQGRVESTDGTQPDQSAVRFEDKPPPRLPSKVRE
jgi:hypothetical protein